MARQKLLTVEIANRLPAMYSTENVSHDKIVQVKFFHPYGRGTWWATEYDPGDRMFYGAVDLGMTDEPEWGPFSLDELESIRGPGGVQGVERDAFFTPKPWREVMAAWRP